MKYKIPKEGIMCEKDKSTMLGSCAWHRSRPGNAIDANMHMNMDSVWGRYWYDYEQI